ncbi:MAG: DEAD/DEAH box helicase family protein [Muribaculaceae bacterium]|nr:DEAD/DEAH box helicase family protein [Muribaculaceae bacterium]
MTPEQKARLKIDKMLKEAGWDIVDRKHYNPAISAVAIEEGLLKGNLEADYLLFLEGKAVGVLEAKREECDLSDVVAEQAENYTHKLLDWYQTWRKPLPLIYLSNGKELLYKCPNTNNEYIPISRVHTPREITKMLNLDSYFAGLPIVPQKGLRDCQYEAITKLEKSFRQGYKKALMVLATGAGKTYTACTAAYRFLSYTPAKRVLFLVDRNNLGLQAEGEFSSYKLTETGDTFNSIYVTERLKSQNIPTDANVIISTIQRLFSAITGQEIKDSDDDEDTDFDDINENQEEVELGNDLKLSEDFFDLIIVDECHRSIYGKWRKVLNYFSTARIIGLTATPAPETLAFFDNNSVVDYTLEKSIADGINVDYRTYRIKTKVTEEGRTLHTGEKYIEHTNYTNTDKTKVVKEDSDYKKEELNRAVIDQAQIKLVLETYKNAIYTELYPNREPDFKYIPKTLIFAQRDKHADSIIEMVKEVFPDQSPNFVKKITCTAGNSNELIRQFRNEKDFRIAVTVTLVATGTDVKPLEVVMFMRDVNSEPLYIQMKGRGCRTIGDEQLKNVTPNADTKDLFYLIDAVGVTEHEKVVPVPGDGSNNKIKHLKELLEEITHGNIPDEYIRNLAGKISRINKKASTEQKEKFEKLAEIDIKQLAMNFYEALEKNTLPPFEGINQPNVERKQLVSNLAEHPEAREYLMKLNAGFITILTEGEDQLIYQGFSNEEAKETTQAFEQYIRENKDSIEALRIIYNDTKEAITYDLLKDLAVKLIERSPKFRIATLWNSYSILEPKNVAKLTTKEQKEALTNLISLVRYAFQTTKELNSFVALVHRNFELWCGQKQRLQPLTDVQRNIALQIAQYIASNGSLTIEEMRQSHIQLLAQSKKEFGSLDSVSNTLSTLSNFILAA